MKGFLEELGRELAPYTEEATRDMETLVERVSENIPGKVKVYALTWWGVYLVHIVAILNLLFSSWVIALICGKGILPAAWFTVNLTVFVAVYNIVFLCRWDEEGWKFCPVCGEATLGGNFCDQCGALTAFPWLLEQE